MTGTEKSIFLEKQNALIEEERLKVLLQIAGLTAHELNQPLTALLGIVELMKIEKNDPQKLAAHISTLEEAGCRILEIAKKIQDIRRGEYAPYVSHANAFGMGAPMNILYVENSDRDFETIGQLLKEFDHVHLLRARGVSEATNIIEQVACDLIFMEHLFPDGKSLDLLDIVHTRNILVPVIVVTGYGDEIVATQVIQHGAYDYLPKDLVSKESLARTIGNALEKARLKQEIRKSHTRMAEMTIRDPLTALYNRRYFVEALEREVARAARYDADLVLCMLDIDHFKFVNDTHGHLAGDMVLSQLGRMLKEYIRESDLICRFGGEEFAIILTHTSLAKAKMVCERFREMVAEHLFSYNGISMHLTVSIGMASYEQFTGVSPWGLVEKADAALYKAKRAGRNRVVDNAAMASGGETEKSSFGFHPSGMGKKESRHNVLKKVPLGEILVRSGRITAAQRDQAMDYQAGTSCRIGDALRTLGHATAEDVGWAVTWQQITPTSLQQ